MQSRFYPRWLVVFCLITLLVGGVRAAESIQVLSDLPYKTGDGLTDYEKERCHLDLYLPGDAKDFPTVVWFHGGSIQVGDKAEPMTAGIAKWFAGQGIAFASVNYRLSPKATYPAYVDDAAASVAWVVRNIESHGGSTKKIFVSGHSAGGYLSAMLGVDAHYLQSYGVSVLDIAGFFPVSGQMITHSTIRGERGIAETTPLIDEAAPSYHVTKDTPPFLNLCGDHDLPARAAENIYFVAAMHAVGNQHSEYREFKDRDHGTLASKIPEEDDPVAQAILEFIEKIVKP